VDVGWASGLTLAGGVYLYNQPTTERTIILSFLLLVWGLRLGLYLWLTRIRHGKIDARYLTLSSRWNISQPLGYFLNFQFQGLLMLIISLPWYFISLSNRSYLSKLDYCAIVLALGSIISEAIADHQLQQFKKSHPRQLCDQGLWHLSRHPNYFFEWLTWCAFSVLAFSHSSGWLALASPLVLYYLMTRVTGPMTEAGSIKSKGQAYRDYQKATPLFFPKLFKK
jgi:steroid 5-alpha reductase family enzyme